MTDAIRIERPQGFKVQTTVFYESSGASHYHIPSGCGGVVLTRNQKPDVKGPLANGELWIVRPQNEGGQWPVVVALINWNDAAAWQSLSVSEVNRMIDRCHRGAMRYKNGMHVRNGEK